jgi:hypothetical protein
MLPEDVFDATKIGMSCVQPDGFALFSPETEDMILDYVAGNGSAYREYEAKHPRAGHLGDEDCLYLNVFTPHVIDPHILLICLCP